MKSICKTQCCNLINGNYYGGLPKRFTRQNPRMVSIRGLFRRIVTDRKRTSRLSPTSCLNISHLNRVSVLNRQKRLETYLISSLFLVVVYLHLVNNIYTDSLNKDCKEDKHENAHSINYQM